MTDCKEPTSDITLGEEGTSSESSEENGNSACSVEAAPDFDEAPFAKQYMAEYWAEKWAAVRSNLVPLNSLLTQLLIRK